MFLDSDGHSQAEIEYIASMNKPKDKHKLLLVSILGAISNVPSKRRSSGLKRTEFLARRALMTRQQWANEVAAYHSPHCKKIKQAA